MREKSLTVGDFFKVIFIAAIIALPILLAGCGDNKGRGNSIIPTLSNSEAPGIVNHDLPKITLFAAGVIREENAITASWAGKIAAVKYELYKSESPTTGFGQLPLSSPTAGGYRDEDFIIGKTYYYKIRYQIDSGEFSEFSEVSSATVNEEDMLRDTITLLSCSTMTGNYNITGRAVEYSGMITVPENQFCETIYFRNATASLYTLTCPPMAGHTVKASAYPRPEWAENNVSESVVGILKTGNSLRFACNYSPE